MTTDIIRYAFKAGLPQEFEIVNVGELYRNSKGILTSIHRAGFYHIIWYQQGSPTHLVDFNPIKIKPSTILFLSKDTVQRFDDKTKFGGKAILFTDSFFCKTETDTRFLRNSILFNSLFSVSQFQVTRQSNLFAGLLQQMTDELKNAKDNSQADILQNLLHNFLLHSEREIRRQNFTEIKKVLTLIM